MDTKITTNWVIEAKKDLQRAGIKQDEILDRVIFRNNIDKWEVIPERNKPKQYRPTWSEERKQQYSQMMKHRWPGRKNK